MKCQLCNIDFDESFINFHHFIPKSFHNNKKIMKLYEQDYLNNYGVNLCLSCHNKLHSCIEEKEMAFEFNTIEKILTIEEIQKWIDWKHKHPDFNKTFNRMTLEKRKKRK